jgi:hypothetical protein
MDENRLLYESIWPWLASGRAWVISGAITANVLIRTQMGREPTYDVEVRIMLFGVSLGKIHFPIGGAAPARLEHLQISEE